MERWYTADLHFGHTKLVERGYRPFGSVEEMNETLIEAWNSVVADRDEVWVLGDFAMRPFDESLGCGLRLRGRKILVPGNHDRCFKGRFNARDPMSTHIARQAMYTRGAGFSQIVDEPAPHRIAGTEVALSHFPYTADHTDEVRCVEHRPADSGGWLLHGHLHEMWRQHERQINVGVDAWGLRPVNADEIAEVVSAGPADRDPLPTTVSRATASCVLPAPVLAAQLR